MIYTLIKTINKIYQVVTLYAQGIRIWFLRTLYKGRFKYGEQFSFKSTSVIHFDITQSIIQLGNGVEVRDYCCFRSEQNGKLLIGDQVFFNMGCSLNCLGSIKIGSHCQFGENVKLYDHNHAHAIKDELISAQGYVIGVIEIGNNCWIGSNVVILKDVIIGNNVVIGAGCIIYKSIQSNSVVINQQNLIVETKDNN